MRNTDHWRPAGHHSDVDGDVADLRMNTSDECDVILVGVHNSSAVDSDVLPAMRQKQYRQQAKECLILAFPVAQRRNGKLDLECHVSCGIAHHKSPGKRTQLHQVL